MHPSACPLRFPSQSFRLGIVGQCRYSGNISAWKICQALVGVFCRCAFMVSSYTSRFPYCTLSLPASLTIRFHSSPPGMMEPLVQSSAFAPPQVTTKEASSQIFVFGDLTSSFEVDLRHLIHVKDNESLRSFFERVNYALRVEIAELPASKRACFPRFTTIIDLLSRYGESAGNPALTFALLCITHIARYIKSALPNLLPYFSLLTMISYYGEGSRPYPSACSSYVIGLCTGSFAAAAISTSQTLSELLPAAIEAVLAAFRTGLCSMEVRDDIDQMPQTTLPIWSVIVGVPEQSACAALDAFAVEKVRSL